MVIYLANQLPDQSSGLPGDRNGTSSSCLLFSLAPSGVCRADESPRRWWAFTLRGLRLPTVSPLPLGIRNSEFRMRNQNQCQFTGFVFHSAFRVPHSEFQEAVYFLLHFPGERIRPTPEVGLFVHGGRYPSLRSVESGLSSPSLHWRRPSARPAEIGLYRRNAIPLKEVSEVEPGFVFPKRKSLPSRIGTKLSLSRRIFRSRRKFRAN